MRFIIDENMSPAIAALLRDGGHDAIAVAQDAPQTPDSGVLAWAVWESRILATLDTDFGFLIYDQALPAPPAVVLFRLGDMPANDTARFIVRNLMAERDWTGHFWVIGKVSIRNRPLPHRR